MAIVANFNKKYRNAIDAAATGIAIEKRLLQTSQFAYQLGYAYEKKNAAEKNAVPKDRAQACEYYHMAGATTDDAIRQNAKDARRRMKCGR
jgi:hypothetical protein